MYYLNKIIGWVTSPIAVTFLVAVAGIVLARFGRRRLGLGLIGGAVAWLWLWATPVMTWVVGVPLEREFLLDGRVPAVESFPEADAIVLLGGSMGVDAKLSPYAEMWTSADRVWQAARLWKAGKAPKIIATGDWAQESTLGLLRDLGVDEKCVEFVGARNTEEEAKVVSAQRLAVRGQSVKPKVLVVTSAWHMKRARMMFEKYAQGAQIVCAPADFECTIGARRGWSILPDPNAFNLNSVALHEWVGILGYGMFR